MTNPLLPIAHKSARIGKIFILKLEGIIKKISYYESVDRKKPILGYVSKKLLKNYNSGTKGLNIINHGFLHYTRTDCMPLADSQNKANIYSVFLYPVYSSPSSIHL